MNRPKILLAGFFEDQVRDLARRFSEADFVALGDERDIGHHRGDALVTMTQPVLDSLFTPDVLDGCRSLRWVHASSAGIDDYLSRLGTTKFIFTCGKIVQGPPVADHAMALLLALTRRLPWALRGIAPSAMPRPTELHGKVALILGLGGIGFCIAERAASFGMRVRAVTETKPPILSFVERVHFGDELPVALPEADVLFIAAPLTPRTRNLLNTEMLGLMKRNSYLINVSRGAIVNLQGLVTTLEQNWFEGVGLDVSDPEPLAPDHPLRAFERVIITPHYAGTTTDRERRFDLITTNIRRFLNGQQLLNVVDKTAGY